MFKERRRALTTCSRDAPGSEMSIHHQVRLRTEPYKKQFGTKVRQKKDVYLVMGEDADDCKWLTTALVWAITTRPWRLEVDVWKSFFNVDVSFLQGLNAKWWE